MLKNKWYSLGKIDGILKSQWKTTSKTMETIRKFQSDNWLTPDGIPWPITISKILDKYGTGWWNGGWWTEAVQEDEKVKDLTKAEYYALYEKTSLTDDEVKQVVKHINKYHRNLSLDWLTSITDKQAEELWKVERFLSLNWLTNITEKQAEELWKAGFWLSLNWLTSITDKQAEELAKVNILYIKEEILTPKQKKILKKHIS